MVGKAPRFATSVRSATRAANSQTNANSSTTIGGTDRGVT